MKILIVGNEEYTADRIVKTDNSIIGYNNNSDTPAWSFKGINDFSQFKLEEGQKWDVDEKILESNYILDLDFRISMIELGV